MEFQVVDKPNVLPKSKWSELKERLRSLPDGQAISIQVDEGKDPQRVARILHGTLRAGRKNPLSIKTLTKGQTLTVWENRRK